MGQLYVEQILIVDQIMEAQSTNVMDRQNGQIYYD